MIVVIIGIIWIPIMANISGVLYEYLQSVQSYIAPPITAVFLLGIFHKRINAQGAFVTMVVGFIVGALRIVLELVKDSLNPDSFWFLLGDMNFLSFASWFFLFCIILIVVVSYATAPPSEEKLKNLTYATISEEEKKHNKNSYNWKDILISLIIIAIVIYVMIWFNGK